MIHSDEWTDAARLVVARELTADECREYLKRESCLLSGR